MLTIRTYRQVADSRSIPSFRACPSLSHGSGDDLGELGRWVQSQGRIRAAESRRQWLSRQWQTRLPK
ncbi:MAG: hypothetical protein HC929_21000 [Leptolyngbyaceae cyanobacterium SM2_5_2]|nr:hypothetical protein [Leptolyngbyaceae cyanobacterium SM2_5_2]